MHALARLLESVRGCIFNSDAEERLTRPLSQVRRSGVVGLGFDPPAGLMEQSPREDVLPLTEEDYETGKVEKVD